MMVYRHKLIPTWLSSTFELLHVYSCVRFFFAGAAWYKRQSNTSSSTAACACLNLHWRIEARISSQWRPRTFSSAKKKKWTGRLRKLYQWSWLVVDEWPTNIQEELLFLAADAETVQMIARRCSVFVPLLTNLLHCNQIAFFVHVFDVYGASVEFSFWFLQENKFFFLLSLVIEPRPVFFAFVCANAVGISSCHDSFNEI